MKKRKGFVRSLLLATGVVSVLGVVAGFYWMNKGPMISVVMSTYNRSHLLPTAIDTILNQTYSDFEFIIINDGSHDKTMVVLKEYALKDNRIKVIDNQKNLGLIASLNKGLAVAKGKYIARMDDDDKSVPTRFELQVDFMENHPDIIVSGTYQHAYDNRFFVPVDSVDVEAEAEDVSVITQFMVPILHPSAMIRRSFLEKHGLKYVEGYDSAEDTPFWHNIVKKGGKIVRLAPPLVVNKPDSQKKPGYHAQQYHSYAKFLNDYLKDIRGEYVFQPRWLSKHEECFILQGLKEKKASYYSVNAVENLMQKKGCLSTYKVMKLNEEKVVVGIEGDKYILNDKTYLLKEKKEGAFWLSDETKTIKVTE